MFIQKLIAGDKMAKTTFAEEVYLRALTGKVVGAHVLGDYEKVAVISVKNIICSATAAAAEAVYSENTGGRAAHFVVEAGNVTETINQVIDFEPEAVLLLFGGETPFDEIKALFQKTVKALADTNTEMDILIHVRIFAAGAVNEAIKDKDVLRYLQNNTVTVYTVDFEKGFILYNELYIPNSDTIELVRIADIPVTVEHADLLNRSLRDKTVKWVDA